jgi:hypothetical protein
LGAGGGTQEPPLRGPGLLTYFDPEFAFQQKRVLTKYPDVLKADGLEHRIPKQQEAEKERIAHRSYAGWIWDGVTSCGSFLWERGFCCSCRRAETRHVRLEDADSLSSRQLSERRKLLERELVATMSAERRDAMHRALLEPVFQAGITISTLVVAQPLLAENQFASGIASLWMFGIGLEYGKKLLSALYQIHVSPFADDLYEPMKNWAAIKRYFPVKFQDFVERKFGIGLRNPFNLGPVVDFMRIAVNLPVRGVPVKSLTYASNPELRLLQDRLKAYSPAVVFPIMKAMVHHAYRSHSNKLPAALDTRPVLYFKGPPGTGKTTVAKFIAEALGVPFIRVQFSGPFEGIIGTDSDPGRILNALTRAGNEAANAVILLDEAGALLKKDGGADMGDFLQLFDPGTDEIRMPYLGEPVNFSRFLVIATGNDEIANEALKNRLIEVHFPEIETDHKIETTMGDLDSSFGVVDDRAVSVLRHRGSAVGIPAAEHVELVVTEERGLPSLKDLYVRTRGRIEDLARSVRDPGMRRVQQAVAHELIGEAAFKLGLIDVIPPFSFEEGEAGTAAAVGSG